MARLLHAGNGLTIMLSQASTGVKFGSMWEEVTLRSTGKVMDLNEERTSFSWLRGYIRTGRSNSAVVSPCLVL